MDYHEDTGKERVTLNPNQILVLGEKKEKQVFKNIFLM